MGKIRELGRQKGVSLICSDLFWKQIGTNRKQSEEKSEQIGTNPEDKERKLEQIGRQIGRKIGTNPEDKERKLEQIGRLIGRKIGTDPEDKERKLEQIGRKIGTTRNKSGWPPSADPKSGAPKKRQSAIASVQGIRSTLASHSAIWCGMTQETPTS